MESKEWDYLPNMSIEMVRVGADPLLMRLLFIILKEKDIAPKGEKG